MKINPVQMEYIFDFNGHKLEAVIQEIAGNKYLKMEIDGKIIDGVQLRPDENHGYIQIFQKYVAQYMEKKHDKYWDIVTNHLDRLKVVSRKMYVDIEELGVTISLCIISEKGLFTLSFNVNGFKDDMICHISAETISEALEKSRIFTTIMAGLNDEMTINLTEYANDGILDEIGWLE